MKVLMIRIEQHDELIRVAVDNLSREDATEMEQAMADALEGMYVVIADQVQNLVEGQYQLFGTER
jgi:hypothetical protein